MGAQQISRLIGADSHTRDAPQESRRGMEVQSTCDQVGRDTAVFWCINCVISAFQTATTACFGRRTAHGHAEGNSACLSSSRGERRAELGEGSPAGDFTALTDVRRVLAGDISDTAQSRPYCRRRSAGHQRTTSTDPRQGSSTDSRIPQRPIGPIQLVLIILVPMLMYPLIRLLWHWLPTLWDLWLFGRMKWSDVRETSESRPQTKR
jgi:hypothetical protein